ncbi:ATP-binding protein [Desulfovibrio inopinatus]|uniref:ATP-binding protein n=1 Tax=Desulfovibrio inopinatus TaxID=102109 RepID=UPI000429328C|nr:ATP-binding protein [Desulfovibrio inopinatus]
METELSDRKQLNSSSKGWRLGLRRRIILCLTGLALTAIAGGITTAWYSYEARHLLEVIIDQDMQGLRIVERLATELSMQKGYTTYYALSLDESYLKDLATHTDMFDTLMSKAMLHPYSEKNHALLETINTEYRHYVADRAKVIELYSQGFADEGARQHWAIRGVFDKISGQVASLRAAQESQIHNVVDNAKLDATAMMYMAWVAVFIAVIIALILGYVLIRKVLDPIRRMAQEGQSPIVFKGTDEIEAIDKRMHGLMDDMDRAREHVMQTEKLALAGKLGAGVAHSVRNPLTSVKMRLFSLSRTLRLDATQSEDFEVITEEIGHIDTILQHFLEFARPPGLRREIVTLAEIVDNAVRLLTYRLDSYGVEVKMDLTGGNRPIHADPERLKEVLVNLLLNACEAMPGGGRILITTYSRADASGRRMAILQIRDWGPGIPEELQGRVFEPFFSTKEDGSGLGLAITWRIIMEHGGTVETRIPEGGGALFEIGLPCKEP